jgi:hypothetical protein
MIKKGTYQLSIFSCLPEFIKTYQQKKFIHEGPNCWGTVLSFNKLFLKPRFVWPEEMMYWTRNSLLCKKLDKDEKKLPGDIISVYAPEKLDDEERNQKDAGTKFWDYLYPKRSTVPTDINGSHYTGFQRLLHSVNYISDTLAFGKDSPSKDDRFYFHSMSAVYGRPSGALEEACQENQILDPYIREYQKTPNTNLRHSKCAYFSQAYRCSNFEYYFSTLKLNNEDFLILKSIKELNIIQNNLFSLFFSNSNNSVSFNESRILAEQAINKSSAELQKPNLEKNHEMLLTMEYFSAAGIIQTLLQLGSKN